MRFRRLLAPLAAPLLALPLTLPLAGCLGDDTVTEVAFATVEGTTFAPSLGVDLTATGWTKSTSGLFSRTLTAAPDPASTPAAAGRTVTVRYTGWLSNGQQFESNTFPGLTLGRGTVIAGWEEGLLGMRVGEKRRLLIPPVLGYGLGGSANGRIPPNAVLVFDVEIVSVS